LSRNIRTHSEDKKLVEERRKHIAEHSIPVFINKGYARTSVEDILKACGMGRGTFYHYVRSKDDVVYLIVKELISISTKLLEDLNREIKNLTATESLRKAIMEYYRLCDKSQDRIMFGDRELIYLSERDRKEILDVVRAEISFFEKLLMRGITTEEFKIRNARALAHDIVVLGHAWATRRWFLRKETTLENYIENHIDLILDAIRVLPGETRVMLE